MTIYSHKKNLITSANNEQRHFVRPRMILS